MNPQANYELPVNLKLTVDEVARIEAILSDFKRRIENQPQDSATYEFYMEFCERMAEKLHKAQIDAYIRRINIEYTEDYEKYAEDNEK